MCKEKPHNEENCFCAENLSRAWLAYCIQRIKTLYLLTATKSSVENIEEVADSLSTIAVIVSDLQRSRAKDYSFDWDKILSFTGDTGPFLQITHARLCRYIDYFNSVIIKRIQSSKSTERFILACDIINYVRCAVKLYA